VPPQRGQRTSTRRDPAVRWARAGDERRGGCDGELCAVPWTASRSIGRGPSGSMRAGRRAACSCTSSRKSERTTWRSVWSMSSRGRSSRSWRRRARRCRSYTSRPPSRTLRGSRTARSRRRGPRAAAPAGRRQRGRRAGGRGERERAHAVELGMGVGRGFMPLTVALRVTSYGAAPHATGRNASADSASSPRWYRRRSPDVWPSRR
jgi:hypothetical protein